MSNRLRTAGRLPRSVAMYIWSLRWAGDCAAMWNLVSLPLIGSLVLSMVFSMHALALVLIAVLLLLFLGVGLAAHSPLNRPDGVIEAAMERWADARRQAAPSEPEN